MAIAKVCGIETEYGSSAGAAESNRSCLVAADQRLRNQLQRKWAGLRDESPGRDARGFAREGAMGPESTHL